MQKILTLMLLVVALILSGATAAPSYAQAPDQQASGMQPKTPDQVVAFLDSKLHLSDDQKKRIEPVIAERQQRLAALREDSSTPRLRKAHKLKGIFEDSDKKIEAVLTEQQKPVYQQVREQMKEEVRARIQAGGSFQ